MTYIDKVAIKMTSMGLLPIIIIIIIIIIITITIPLIDG
jgi:hypothetical protein